MSIQATLYKRPHGHKVEITVTNISPEAAKYLTENNVKVSLEDCGMMHAIYFDDGTMRAGEPDEVTLLAGSQQECRDIMDQAVRIIQKRKSNAV